MSENCTPTDCESCTAACPSKGGEPQDFAARLASGASVKHVYAVMSGKGGVGKSLVTAMLACSFQKAGFRTAILDADITGPSIPKAFGVEGEPLLADENQLMIPVESAGGISILSANFLVPNATDPIVWRGALIASAVQQFYEETLWDNIDYMFVDMPPGTGDVPLTVLQSLPVEGIIIVTSPQDLVSMIVAKAVNMARLMQRPILGIVENFSYYKCPDCGREHYIFGKSHLEEVAAKYNLSILARLPIDPGVAGLIDAGKAEELDVSAMDKARDIVIALDKFRA